MKKDKWLDLGFPAHLGIAHRCFKFCWWLRFMLLVWQLKPLDSGCQKGCRDCLLSGNECSFVFPRMRLDGPHLIWGHLTFSIFISHSRQQSRPFHAQMELLWPALQNHSENQMVACDPNKRIVSSSFAKAACCNWLSPNTRAKQWFRVQKAAL